jgi:hypothetical protein
MKAIHEREIQQLVMEAQQTVALRLRQRGLLPKHLILDLSIEDYNALLLLIGGVLMVGSIFKVSRNLI